MKSTAYPVPAWRVVLDGEDLTRRIAPRLLDLSLSEHRGEEADQICLRLHDHDGRLALPRRGVELQVAIGWEGGGLFDKGTFTVDDVEHSGAPDILSIRARSANLAGAVRSRRERSWHDATLGDIVSTIAGEHSLRPSIAADLARVMIPHLDQANESDINLLTRLGRRFDAAATIKAGTLIFAPIGAGTTASGLPLPSVQITRMSGDQHRYVVADRDRYTGVRAYWSDRRAGRRTGVLVGSPDNEKKLQATYATAEEARQHATAEYKRLERGTARLHYRLALGRADIYPEQTVAVTGFKPEIDSAEWLVTEVIHSITGSGGFVTEVDLELLGYCDSKTKLVESSLKK